MDEFRAAESIAAAIVDMELRAVINRIAIRDVHNILLAAHDLSVKYGHTRRNSPRTSSTSGGGGANVEHPQPHDAAAQTQPLLVDVDAALRFYEHEPAKHLPVLLHELLDELPRKLDPKLVGLDCDLV